MPLIFPSSSIKRVSLCAQVLHVIIGSWTSTLATFHVISSDMIPLHLNHYNLLFINSSLRILLRVPLSSTPCSTLNFYQSSFSPLTWSITYPLPYRSPLHPAVAREAQRSRKRESKPVLLQQQRGRGFLHSQAQRDNSYVCQYGHYTILNSGPYLSIILPPSIPLYYLSFLPPSLPATVPSCFRIIVLYFVKNTAHTVLSIRRHNLLLFYYTVKHR